MEIKTQKVCGHGSNKNQLCHAEDMGLRIGKMVEMLNNAGRGSLLVKGGRIENRHKQRHGDEDNGEEDRLMRLVFFRSVILNSKICGNTYGKQRNSNYQNIEAFHFYSSLSFGITKYAVIVNSANNKNNPELTGA
jgi:hypothetical protein